MTHQTELETALTTLVRDHADSTAAWRQFHLFLSSEYERFTDCMGKYLKEDELMHLLTLLLVSVARQGLKNSSRKEQLFRAGEDMGVHVMPVHYYSPVPETRTISEAAWTHRFDQTPGWRLQSDKQLELLQTLGQWSSELADIPADTANPSEFAWNNPAFAPGDASVYYAMIRQFKPRRILEVGCGYSTLIAAKAALRNKTTELHCIEPYPMPFLRDGFPGLTSLRQTPIQETPVAEFEGLESEDILFIDTTHVSKVASDVNHLVLEVLPRVGRGVLVHVHDIFLPWEMPKQWIKERQIFWNEQYLLLAFLLFNNAFEVILANQYLGVEHADAFRSAFPLVAFPGGGSFWMRRI